MTDRLGMAVAVPIDFCGELYDAVLYLEQQVDLLE